MNRRPSPQSINALPRRRASQLPAADNHAARPSHFQNRTLSALSVVEHGHDATAISAEDTIHDEIDQIKRYEDFTTIDWVQDAAREQRRRRARRQEKAGFFARGGSVGLRQKLWESYDAAQGWVVVTLVGLAIGFNAAILNIATEWLSDIKLGYCTTAFYLNESFCCWGQENGCDEWRRWSPGITPVNYLFYILFATLFAFISARLVKAFAPYAAGSGISEIKCIIAGFVMKGFLGFWTLFIKSVGLPLAIASGLSVGKEGPSVHYAVCTGNVISRLFEKFERNAAKTREILSASAAAGVAVAFGSPIGGVIFSLEEMSNYFPLKTMWRSYFCALVATAVLAAMNPFRTGQLVMFQVKYDRDWHFFEIIFYIILGIFGGLYGAFMIKWNLWAQAFRKKYLTRYAVLEATLLATFTAVICYPNMFLRIDMTESMETLFLECDGQRDYDGLCDKDNRFELIMSLALATVVRMFLVVISYGCKVPAGIFVPSMAIGASFGRMIGVAVQALHETYPKSSFFAACKPDVPCITPGTYAFLGAGAALSGIMHITVSVVVIMFELTGALTYILPTMIVVGVTKAVSDRFGKGGIADRMIWFNGFPFLDNKEEHSFGVSVSQVMTKNVTALPATGLTLADVEDIIANNNFQGFPIVAETSETDFADNNSMHSDTQLGLIGYIGRTELLYAIARARRETFIAPSAGCIFARPSPAIDTTSSAIGAFPTTPLSAAPITPGGSIVSQAAFLNADNASEAGPSSLFPRTTHSRPRDSARTAALQAEQQHTDSAAEPESLTGGSTTAPSLIDFTRFVNHSPISVHPRLPLETAMEVFKKLGPRSILVEYHGRLAGLLTIKDCLKYQFTADAHESPRDARSAAETHERIWRVMQHVAFWVRAKASRISGGRINLGSSDFTEQRSDGRNTGSSSGGGGGGGGGLGLEEPGEEVPVMPEDGSGPVRGARAADGLRNADPDMELEDRFPLGGS